MAPAPASALLSGILTKAGMYGILILTTCLFFKSAAWGGLILILGVFTMIIGAVLALFSIDLKRTLACSSVSQIGFILGNGKPQIDIQPPARRAGVVLFLCGFPAAAVGFQNFHDLVIIGHGTEPAIQAGKEDKIHLVPPHVFQHTQEVCALAQALPGGLRRVDVDADNHPQSSRVPGNIPVNLPAGLPVIGP